MVMNSSVVNLDKLKIIRFNRTTLVTNGSFVLHFENIAIEDLDVRI